MAYNQFFPVGYQPVNYQPVNNYSQAQYNQANQLAQNSGLIWVQGEAGAKSYMVAPNSTVQLWDSEAQVIYLKSADASGMPSIKTLDYTIREIPSQAHEKAPEAAFATKEDISTLQAEIAKIKEEIKHGKSVISDVRESAE